MSFSRIQRRIRVPPRLPLRLNLRRVIPLLLVRLHSRAIVVHICGFPAVFTGKIFDILFRLYPPTFQPRKLAPPHLHCAPQISIHDSHLQAHIQQPESRVRLGQTTVPQDLRHPRHRHPALALRLSRAAIRHAPHQLGRKLHLPHRQSPPARTVEEVQHIVKTSHQTPSPRRPPLLQRHRRQHRKPDLPQATQPDGPRRQIPHRHRRSRRHLRPTSSLHRLPRLRRSTTLPRSPTSPSSEPAPPPPTAPAATTATSPPPSPPCEFVTADGCLHISPAHKDADTFPGAVVHLGALGIITSITLDVQPTFQVAQSVYENLSFDHLEHHLDEIFLSGYSVSLFTDWQNHRITQVWIKRRVEPGNTPTPSRPSSSEPNSPPKNSTHSPDTPPKTAPSNKASPAPGTNASLTSA